MYTGYSEEQLMNIIDWKKATLLRDELKRKGEVLPATRDVVFKNVMMNSKIFLSIILEYFLGIDKKIRGEALTIEQFANIAGAI